MRDWQQAGVWAALHRAMLERLQAAGHLDWCRVSLDSASVPAKKGGLPQPKLSGLLRGQFRGVSEAKMLACLTRLGRDVRIVVGPSRRRAGAGRIGVLSG